MSLLIKDAIMSKICDELAHSKDSVMIISAFCKLPLIQQFDMNLNAGVDEKVLLVRFRPEDILNGASDLDLYPYCKSHGWKLYFRLDLHAKTYVFDRIRCVVGSANVTESGMNVGTIGNYEMATFCLLSEEDLHKMHLLLKGSIRMTDAVYDNMKQVIDKYIENVEGQSIEWPEEVINQIKPDYSFLFSEDFPACASPINASVEELLFLNIQPTEDLDYIRECMELSKCYNWLKDLIEKAPNHEMYFGTIAVQLHERLLDEPKPYRKDVKVLLANLLSWISILRCTDLIIDKPNYSQRVRLS